ncbi:DUF4259 domain-containing protein [Corynebacterium cystitidis]|uniref:DUF4259 domain-containing protein n=1 Tax=Corynebacterium cystitidis DSM 20524 TaxID=1121357 RepID=A0A1H9QHH1_9CORY|nr:hypothetical protein [Corynebacterium cystitidis]WJY81780.1 hypothetical protein CCYS_04130 [Corynebacterium cystitidis DSM 20524]SER59880.1 hypothetical protein SAMN05661109_00541 [Corynebacterium cystitidis DSM 20524]SNV83679.1 Uncharacterised protein [Corynebacterium cystitidis]
MSTWDAEIFAEDINVEFLDELAELDDADIIESVNDACLLAANQDNPTEDELLNGQAAATIAAIWAGAPFTAGEVAEEYPFIRSLMGEGSEALAEAAVTVLENVDTEYDIDQFLEALA